MRKGRLKISLKGIFLQVYFLQQSFNISTLYSVSFSLTIWHYIFRAESLASEIRDLQGELGDYNTVSRKWWSIFLKSLVLNTSNFQKTLSACTCNMALNTHQHTLLVFFSACRQTNYRWRYSRCGIWLEWCKWLVLNKISHTYLFYY